MCPPAYGGHITHSCLQTNHMGGMPSQCCCSRGGGLRWVCDRAAQVAHAEPWEQQERRDEDLRHMRCWALLQRPERHDDASER